MFSRKNVSGLADRTSSSYRCSGTSAKSYTAPFSRWTRSVRVARSKWTVRTGAWSGECRVMRPWPAHVVPTRLQPTLPTDSKREDLFDELSYLVSSGFGRRETRATEGVAYGVREERVRRLERPEAPRLNAAECVDDELCADIPFEAGALQHRREARGRARGGQPGLLALRFVDYR